MGPVAIVAATFDCFGTLVDWNQGISAFFRERGRASEEKVAEWERRQRELIQGPYQPYREIMKQSLREVLPDLPPQDVSAFPESLLKWPIFPDVADLDVPGIRLGILSNMDTDLLSATIRRLPIKIDFFVSAEQVRSYKPRLEHFRRALEILKCRPEQVAHCAFGVFYDIAPARSLGMRTVLVRRSKVEDTGSPDVVVGGLAELPRVLSMLA